MTHPKLPCRLMIFFALLLVAGNIKLKAQNTVTGPAEQKKEVPLTVDEIAGLRTAIEANPDDLKKHKDYIKATGFGAPEDLKKQYEVWMKQFPQSVTVPFAIGQAFYNEERPEATPYLLKVVAMDPKRGDVFEMLAIDACRWGDYPANARYEKMAWDADPSNFTFARHYALALKGRDKGEWKLLCRDVEKQFAGTDNASQALGLIGIFSDDPKEKEAIFLEQLKKYPADKFPSTKNGISWLASLYLATNPAKSAALYKQLISEDTTTGRFSNKPYYQKNLNYAEAFVSGQEQMNKGQYKEALETLSKIKVGRGDPADAAAKMQLMKAESLSGTGNNAAAYDTLLAQASLKPSDDLLAAVKKYGGKLGKSEKQMQSDRWNVISATAKPAADFTLYAYLEKKNISLSDYRGKTVFLSFWFPGCGPCRAEMVHLEPVVRKFKNKDFAYVGINGLTEQDDYVESFMQKTGFSFTPLQDLGSKASKAYGVRGYPSNFIIDPTGKIVYSGFQISTKQDERMLELIIQSVLDQK